MKNIILCNQNYASLETIIPLCEIDMSAVVALAGIAGIQVSLYRKNYTVNLLFFLLENSFFQLKPYNKRDNIT
jgi:hypothetical protein